MWEKKRNRDRETEKGKREEERECVCVSVCLHTYTGIYKERIIALVNTGEFNICVHYTNLMSCL